MSVSNGQSANATTFNSAFVSKSVNSTTIGQVTLNNADASSGAQVSNIQREFNSFSSFVGKSTNIAYNAKPSWADNSIGASTDSLFERVEAIQAQFPIDLSTSTEGVLPIANGGTGKSSFQNYRVLFGQLEQASAFVYKDGLIGVGTASPSGTMDIDGGLCFHSENVSIASGVLPLSDKTIVRITAQSTTDALKTIPAPSYGGQQIKLLMNISGGDLSINDTGNIETSGMTITFAENSMVLLAWDATSSIWRILAGGSGSGGVEITNFDQGDTGLTMINASEQIWRFTAESPEAGVTVTGINFTDVPQGGYVTFTSQSDSAYPCIIPVGLTNVIQNGEWVGTQYAVIKYQRIGPRIIEVNRNYV